MRDEQVVPDSFGEGSGGFFRVLVENSLDVLMVADAEGRPLYVNPAQERILGYTREEFTAFEPSDVVHPDDVEGMVNYMAGAAANPGANPVGRYRIQHKDGSWRWFEAIANNLLHEPGVRALVVNCRDITERKEAEAEIVRLNAALEDRVDEGAAALRASEEQLRVAFEVTAAGMAQVDTAGHYLRVNKKLRDMLGYTEEELLARTFHEITHSDDLDAELEHVRGLLSGASETYSMEKRYIRKDRIRVWVNLSVSIARGPSGEPRHFIQVAEDITKRKEAEALLGTLTPREVEVLEHLVLGKTNPEIAASTSFSLGSVKLQVRDILYKLSVSDRTQAAARAVELGLTDAG